MVRKIKSVLITGVTGSGARYLVEYLKSEHPELELHGTARRKNSRKAPAGVKLYEVDLLDVGSLIRCINTSCPTAIFHLAANPDKGFEIPSSILMNNGVGSVNLFEAIREHEIRTGYRIRACVNASSSEIYGAVRLEEIPIKEECPKRPCSPYAVSKLVQDTMARIYYEAYGMNIITARSFTYNNFYRTNLFTSDFARQIALIEAGKLGVLKHGNLESVRVMCGARDIARAYWLAATMCRPGEAYNIGGGEKVTVGEVLDKLVSMATVYIPTEKDPSLLRPVDVTLQVPDCSKFKAETGWESKFDLDSSLRDLLNHWRKEVRKE